MKGLMIPFTLFLWGAGAGAGDTGDGVGLGVLLGLIGLGLTMIGLLVKLGSDRQKFGEQLGALTQRVASMEASLAKLDGVPVALASIDARLEGAKGDALRALASADGDPKLSAQAFARTLAEELRRGDREDKR